MSASERLKSLEPLRPEQLQPALTSLAWEDYERIKAYCDALPEIIAVVEAAEAVRDYEPFEVTKDDFAYDRLVESYRTAVSDALAALDAKLTTEEKQ